MFPEVFPDRRPSSSSLLNRFHHQVVEESGAFSAEIQADPAFGKSVVLYSSNQFFLAIEGAIDLVAPDFDLDRGSLRYSQRPPIQFRRLQRLDADDSRKIRENGESIVAFFTLAKYKTAARLRCE